MNASKNLKRPSEKVLRSSSMSTSSHSTGIYTFDNIDGSFKSHLLANWFPYLRRKMSTLDISGDGQNSSNYLSWRKLQLSRAKLKASSKTSALLSGFAMAVLQDEYILCLTGIFSGELFLFIFCFCAISRPGVNLTEPFMRQSRPEERTSLEVAMVEVQLNPDSKVPKEMYVIFAVVTTLLVAVHMLALMISTCILPNIEAVCNLHSISLVHESPHERLHWYIETAWAFSTLLGLLLFLCEIAILCYVKFYDFSYFAAWSASIIVIPVFIVFVAFAVHFYRSLVSHKYEVTVSGIRELELLKEQIEASDLEGRNNGNLGGQVV